MNKNIFRAIFGILLIGILVLLYSAFAGRNISDEKSDKTTGSASSTKNGSQSSQNGQNGQGVFVGGVDGLEFVDVGEGAAALPPGVQLPNLDRVILIPQNIPADMERTIEERIKTISSELKTNPTIVALWLDLGLLRKSIRDYEGAKEAWEFVTVISPDDGIAYHNLADLYGYYLHNNELSERNILRAIENSPAQIQNYFKAAEIYQDVFNDMNKARAIVERGLVANPGDESLLSLLASLN